MRRPDPEEVLVDVTEFVTTLAGDALLAHPYNRATVAAAAEVFAAATVTTLPIATTAAPLPTGTAGDTL